MCSTTYVLSIKLDEWHIVIVTAFCLSLVWCIEINWHALFSVDNVVNCRY